MLSPAPSLPGRDANIHRVTLYVRVRVKSKSKNLFYVLCFYVFMFFMFYVLWRLQFRFRFIDLIFKKNRVLAQYTVRGKDRE